MKWSRLKINNDINSTSKQTAECPALVLRETKTTRISYIPKIVYKGDKNFAKNICGNFLAQKKGTNEDWETQNIINLSKLKKGEWVKFELNTSEWLASINYASKLQEMCIKEKDFNSILNKQILILDENIDKEAFKDIIKNLSENSEKIEIIKQLLKDESTLNILFEDGDYLKKILSNINSENKDNIFNQINLEKINPKELNDNLSNSNENFWQNLFKINPYYLSVITPSILRLIASQAYMGAKSIDNKGASIADFVYEQGIKNMCIIEIKTPCTELIISKYRNNTYTPSEELVSGLIQLKEQKDSFLKNYNSIVKKSEENDISFEAFDPKCYLIIGNTKMLNNVQLKSFNLFRNELRSVEIITFDELVEKLQELYVFLGGNND